jgi:predicted permease
VRSVLIVAQVALCTTLLIVSAALIRSLDVERASRGFETKDVAMATINLSGSGYTPETASAFLEVLMQRVMARPGVVSATIVDNVPLMPTRPLEISEVTTADTVSASIYKGVIAPGYFRTLRISTIEGRDFRPYDNAASVPVGIVNVSMAERLWPGETAIGKRFVTNEGESIEVVGVAADIKYESLMEQPRLFLYRPLAQHPVPTATLLVKTAGASAAAVGWIRDDIAALDPELIAYDMNALEDRIGLHTLPNRAVAAVGAVLGVFGLMLSVIGIYGTISLLARQRFREIGIRLALGAQPFGIVRLIARQGMTWTAAGLGIGIVAAIALSSVLKRFLYGVSAFDSVSFIGVAAFLALAAGTACVVPARRAGRADPISALRED